MESVCIFSTGGASINSSLCALFLFSREMLIKKGLGEVNSLGFGNEAKQWAQFSQLEQKEAKECFCRSFIDFSKNKATHTHIPCSI